MISDVISRNTEDESKVSVSTVRSDPAPATERDRVVNTVTLEDEQETTTTVVTTTVAATTVPTTTVDTTTVETATLDTTTVKATTTISPPQEEPRSSDRNFENIQVLPKYPSEMTFSPPGKTIFLFVSCSMQDCCRLAFHPLHNPIIHPSYCGHTVD